jgi:hypothetical protein
MIVLFIKLAPVWICFLLVWCLLHLLADRKAIRGDFSLLWTLATIATGLLLVSIAELASFLNLLVPGFVLGAWITVDVVLAAAFARLSSRRGQRIGATVQDRIRQWRAGFKGLEGVPKCLIAATAGFIVALGFCAAKTPTTIWDCQTYHMPRIMHWLQQHSLHHYPTNIPRQLESSPGAEIEMAQLMLLTGDDQPVNLPQWWALLTGAIAASFLARELFPNSVRRKTGGEKPALELAGAFVFLLAATLPEAAAEAPTAQNNLLAAMWILIAVTLGFLFAGNPGNNYYALAAGAALALGIGVKATAFL